MSEIQQIAQWWSSRPMTYGQVHGEPIYKEGTRAVGTRAFFESADRQFYAWNAPLHDARPFGRLFPYDTYRDRDVLEIGCGMGAMAMNWAQQGARVTAVDLTGMAIERTRERFAVWGLSANIRQADARQLPFPDASFDYVYSWGVLHHAPELARSVAELKRVLKSGGRYGVMLYNRNSLLYRYMVRYLEGFLHDESRFLSPLELASRYGDGAREEGNPYTWPITRREARAIFGPEVGIRILGTDLDGVLPFLIPGIGRLLPGWAVKPWARRLGWSLWITGGKP